MEISNWFRPCKAVSLVAALVFAQYAQPQPAARSVVEKQKWWQNAVIYEIYPRDFSAEGNFNGITAQLDRLKDLGVTILWLMPIHPIGQEKKKGTIGSPYAVRDYYAINPDYGTAPRRELKPAPASLTAARP